jgi:hypothetical protein
VLLYGLLAFAPLAFGTVAAWSREVFVLLVAAAAVVVVVKHVVQGRRGPGYRWSWTYPLMVAFLALCAAQAVPLPRAWVSAVSPATVRLKAELLADLPNVAAVLHRTTISFYSLATVGQVVMVAALAALFAVVLDVFREPARIRRLLLAIVVVGLAVAGLAGYQNLTGSTMIYGVVPAAHPNSGPFMNHSHFSQFMNLSIGAALALLLDRLADLSEFYRTPREVWGALGQPANWSVWACALLCVAGPVTVLLSLSRMGMISLAVATVVTGCLLAWRGRTPGSAGGDGRAWLLVGMGLAVFVVLLYVGFDAVSGRLASLRAPANAVESRDEMLRDMVAEFRQFPVLGTGLGTHEFVFGMYDHRGSPTLATHAENEYAQLMEETGVVGVALGAGFLALVVGTFVRAMRRPEAPVDYVPFGLGFGLIAILIHSGSDFGQHIPADAALTATFAALLVSVVQRRSQPARSAATPDATPSQTPPTVAPWMLPAVGRFTVAVGVVAVAVAMGVWADRARAAESLGFTANDQAAALDSTGWQGSDVAYADLVNSAAAASAREPGDVEYRYWTVAYRWQAIARGTDGTHLPPAALPAVRQLVIDLEDVRALCPTYGPAVSVEGQMNRDVLGRADLGSRQIALSCRLAPYSQPIRLIAGFDALMRHHWDEAATIFADYVSMGGSPDDFADACVHEGQPLIAYRLACHDRGQLLYLADRMPQSDPAWMAWVAHCRRQAAKLLAASAAKPDAPPGDLADEADVEQQQGHAAVAIALYRRALAVEYGNVGWRLGLARVLLASGQVDDARREADVCLQLRPEMAEAKALRSECDSRPDPGTTRP